MLNRDNLSFRESRKTAPKPQTVRVPAVVSRYCARPDKDGVGEVMRYMFPKKGLVSEITVEIESLKDHEEALIEIAPMTKDGTIQRIRVKDRVNKIPGEFKVRDGDKLVVSVLEPQVDRVWVSFLFTVEV